MTLSCTADKCEQRLLINSASLSSTYDRSPPANPRQSGHGSQHGYPNSNKYLFHALAIDEHRKAFTATLWTVDSRS